MRSVSVVTIEGVAGAVRAERPPSIVHFSARSVVAEIAVWLISFVGRSLALLAFAVALLLV